MIVSLELVTSRRTLSASWLAPAAAAVWLAAAPAVWAADSGAASRLVLRNGTVYLLKEPPRISGTRVVFTTLEGKMFSLDESEVASIGAAPAPTPFVRRYDQEDSRALGAIARQQRDARGKRAEVAPRAASRQRTPARAKTPKPSRSVRPRPTPRASPGAGTKSPG